MIDYGNIETEQRLTELEGKIFRVYQQAASEVEQKLIRHLEAYDVKDRNMRAKMESGEITRQEYNNWRRGQVMTGERWERLRDTLSEDMYNCDLLAASMINGHTPEVYALNHDYGTFEAETGAGINTSYTLYNRQAVERLMTQDERIIPQVSPNHVADVRWNQQRFNAGILQSILQGESVGQTARRVALGAAESDFKAALRNARTATTSAQNSGRVDAYKRAQGMGVKMKQMWLATRDKRTRDSHIALDGQIREIGKPFDSPLGEIMYPGDPSARPANVWNCRCRLCAVVKGMDIDSADLSMRDDKLDGMPYEEWKKEHMSKEDYEKWKIQYARDRETIQREVEELNEKVKRFFPD